MSSRAYVAVHGGAGVHSTKNGKETKQALKKACMSALAISSANTGNSSLYMVETAIKVLEDDGSLNAGYGSNLTLDGTVECDAAIMHSCSNGSNAERDEESLFGSIGAVSGIKNPISAARAVLEHSKVKDRLGRVPPLTLVSDGAHSFATARGVESIDPRALISPYARSQWEKWKALLESTDEPSSSLLRDEEEEGLTDVQDTVGAVACHTEEGFAAGVSSGGILLKYPGRVGEAATFGAGCWASRRRNSNRTGVEGMSCSISGTGEDIVKMALARRIGEALRPSSSDADEKDPHDILNRLLVEFWEMARRRGEECPSVGAIVLTAEGDGDGGISVRLWCAFTTASMAVGYASTGNPKPKVVIFRHPNPHRERGEDRPQIFITSLSL